MAKEFSKYCSMVENVKTGEMEIIDKKHGVVIATLTVHPENSNGIRYSICFTPEDGDFSREGLDMNWVDVAKKAGSIKDDED